MRLLAGAAAFALLAGVGANTGGAAAQVSADRLMHDVRVLADPRMEGRAIGTRGGARAREYLAERLRGIGLSPTLQPFRARGRERTFRGVNLFVTVPGTSAGGRVIVVGAHYDHLGRVKGRVHPGADDNASGVAAVLALAESLRAAPPRHDVILGFWDGEEPGFYGSRAFVAAPPVPLSRIALNLNLDMVSRSARGELYAVGGRSFPTLQPVLDRIAADAPVSLRFGHEGPPSTGSDDWVDESDHHSFAERGIPFVYFGVEDHPDYHKPTDTPDRIAPDFFRRSTETILRAFRAFDAELPAR